MAKSSIVAGFVAVAIVSVIVVVLVFSMMVPGTEEPALDIDKNASSLDEGWPDPEFDLEKVVSILNEKRPAFAQFSIHEADWEVSKEQIEEIAITFVELEDWDEFKASLVQSTHIISVDEESRVIWYGKYHVIYIFY